MKRPTPYQGADTPADELRLFARKVLDAFPGAVVTVSPATQSTAAMDLGAPNKAPRRAA